MIQEQDTDGIVLEQTRREAFVQSLLSKRKEAIQGRAASGIENDWLEDEESYQGIDAANRAFVNSGGMTRAKNWATGYGQTDTRQISKSVIFLNITRPYVDAASARVADMLLPTDDRSWTIKPTPLPRMTSQIIQQLGGHEMAQALIEQAREEATAKATAMQDDIDDDLNESNWHGEIRQVIEDAARIGSGVVKGPFPVKRKAKVFQNGMMIEMEEIRPGSKRIDAWNFYPDPACGESIHNGSYTWEREFMSSRQLRDMVGMPGYDTEAIIAALKEGPKHSTETNENENRRKSDEQFELWIFYGACDADDLETVGVESEDETPKVSAMAVFVNDRLIKCALNVLDTGEFPYDVLSWQRRPNMPWGMGVARHIRTPQRMLNGSARAMMDNSGLTASPQIILGNGVTPADGVWSLTGGKQWRADPDVANVRDAFFAWVPPSVQQEMMNIIQFSLKVAEDATGLPAMLQGIRGDAPETLGGMQMANNNASSVLRRLAKRFDDYLTKPHIHRYYNWKMQHSDREDIKGDFNVDVRASSALVERDAQQQFLMTLLTASANPIYELDPAKLATELLKGMRYDPKRVKYDPAKLEEMRQAQSQANPLDEAKAKLIEQQAKKTGAETTAKNIEAIFSATSAANQIALQPNIAPLSDKLLRSGGFVDYDSAPIVPEPETGEEGIEGMPQNTSPNFPPRTGHPDEGMNDGIETGE